MKNSIAFLFVISFWYFPILIYGQEVEYTNEEKVQIYRELYAHEQFVNSQDSVLIISYQCANTLTTESVFILCKSYIETNGYFRFVLLDGNIKLEHISNISDFKCIRVKFISKEVSQ